MKTSFKIIIAFGIFIFGSTLTLFIYTKNHKSERAGDKFVVKEYSLKPFTVIVAENGSDVHVDQSDSNKVGIEYEKGKEIPANLYKTSGDTLYVYSGLRLFVKCTNVHSLIGNKHKWIGVSGISAKTMDLRMSGGEFYLMEGNNASIQTIHATANNGASLEIGGLAVQTLHLEADHSTLRVLSIAKTLNAKLKNESTIEFVGKPIDRVNIEKDVSSGMRTLDSGH